MKLEDEAEEERAGEAPAAEMLLTDWVAVWDEGCPFCWYEADYLRRKSRGRIRVMTKEEGRSLHNVRESFALGPGTRDQVVLVSPGGEVFFGANARAQALLLNPWLFWLRFFYSGFLFPFFLHRILGPGTWHRACAAGPRANAEPCERHRKVLHERPASGPAFLTSTDWFISLLAIISLTAFFSLHVQITSLIGRKGLLPATEFLKVVKTNVEARPDLDNSIMYRLYPSLFWRMAPTDQVLKQCTLAGAALSILILLRIFPKICLGAQLLLYLSIVSVSQVFLAFQWDNLLLECLFLSLFLPVRRRRLLRPWRRPLPIPQPSRMLVFLMHWLLFRIYFESGISKIMAGATGGWLDLSAMKFYYNTAPLPTWKAIYALNLPGWWHEWESALTLFIEILLPFTVFGGRTLRRIGFIVFTGLQVLIIQTANYAFFNYLSLALHVFFLDDQDWELIKGPWRWSLGKLGWGPLQMRVVLPRPRRWVRAAALLPIVTVLFLATNLSFALTVLRGKVEKGSLLEQFRSVYGYYQPFRVANAYHLFASMTRERVVIEIQGSNDLRDWQPYRFRYLPGDVKQRPIHVAPHQPRLDFRLWFVAFAKSGSPRGRTLDHPYQYWYYTRKQFPAGRQYFLNLLDKILHDPGSVSCFFEVMPFAEPPKYLRLAYYDYKMNDLDDYKKTSNFWKRKLIGYDEALIVRKRKVAP